MKFSEIIKQARKKKGISQADLINYFGFYGSAIFNDLENDCFIPKNPEFIRKLANILEIDPDMLFCSLDIIPDDVKKILLQEPAYFKMIRSMWKKNK